MRHGNLLTLLLPLVLLRPAQATAQAPDVKPELAANAALKYWQAFAQMPALDKDQEKLLGQWNKAPLDEAALKLIAASEKSRLYLYRGAKLRRCEWSIDYDDGLSLLLTHHIKARDLARLAALHARREFAQGHREAGVEDAIGMMALARHVGSEPLIICILMRYLIERDAIELVAPYLPDLQALSPKIVFAYEAMPAGATLQQAFLAEKKYMVQWMIEKLREAEQRKKGSWRSFWKGVWAGSEGPDLAKEVDRIDTFEQAIHLLEDLLPVYDQLAKVAGLPTQEFSKQYPAFEQTFIEKSADRLARRFLPAAGSIFARHHHHQAQIELFKAAVAVVRGGPDKLKDIKDPFGSGPFEYRVLDKGFELKSQLLYMDKPVLLRVGNGKME